MRWKSQTRRRYVALVGVLFGVTAVAMAPPSSASPPAPARPAAPSSPPEGTIPDLSAFGWEPVFDEDFTGTSVDESVWRITNNHPYTEKGVRTADTVGVDDGNLELTTYTDASGQPHTSVLETGGLGQHNPTWGGFDAAFGYLEARMLFPDGPYSKSNFWTMSRNGNNSVPFGDPASDGPELDIVEHSNYSPTGTDGDGDDNDDGNCDWPSSSTVPCSEQYLAGGHWDGFEEDHKPMHHEPVANPDPSTSLQGNFHTYGVLWTPDEYRYFVDGQQVKHVTAGQTHIPEHLILSTTVRRDSSGQFADYGPLGDPDNEVTLVDYVKVWQRPVSYVPDQTTAASTPLAVPFTVQDYFYGSTAHDEPGSVIVTASSSDTNVIPQNGLAVSGNGPDQPAGTFTNGGFEGGDTGWTLNPEATVSDSTARSGSDALHLGQAGGRATQTIDGLRPNTTYLVGGHTELHLGFDDLDGDGRVDPGENFTESGDGTASVDIGVEDVDSSMSGDQEVRTSSSRNGWTERNRPAHWVHEPWLHDFVKFTTGPATTSVTLFVDNTEYVGEQDDSDVSFDDLYVRPVVPPQRTLAIRPVDGAVGTSEITLTAEDASGSPLGTDTFDVAVGASPLRDGAFEAGRAATAWAMSSGAEVVAPDPFQPDREVRMSDTGAQTMSQRVSGLEPETRYRVDFTGRVADPGGAIGGAVGGYNGGELVSTTLRSTNSTTQSVEFVTGAAATQADVMWLAWQPQGGVTFAESTALSECATTTSCDTVVASMPADPPPDLGTVGTQHGVSNTSINIAVNLPPGVKLEGVTSTNQELIPNTSIAVTGAGQRRNVITATPIQDHTGTTNLRVAYTGAAGSPVDIPVVVSDEALLSPGFENRGSDWTTSGDVTELSQGAHGGTVAMRVDGNGELSQEVRGLPHGSGFVLRGWVDGTATVTLRTVPLDANEQSEELASAEWTGTGWTERSLDFTTLLCTSCVPEHWRPVEIVITDADPNDGISVTVDELSLTHAPVIRRTRDISLHSGQTAYSWQTDRTLAVGRVAPNGLWDPAVVSVASSDIAGFGAGVVPTADISGPKLSGNGWPYWWNLGFKAGDTTGRSEIETTLTDPATGDQTTETFAVTVNAGDNFNNGDFERSSLSETSVNTGWGAGRVSNSFGIVQKQAWRHLGIHSSNPNATYVGPRDDNKVLRISEGAAEHAITGLTPGTEYTVVLRAKGDGSAVKVKPYDDILSAPVLGEVDVAPPNDDNVWRDYSFTFTTNAEGDGSTSVVVYIVDDAASSASSLPCAVYAESESCFDDIGIFRSDDLT